MTRTYNRHEGSSDASSLTDDWIIQGDEPAVCKLMHVLGRAQGGYMPCSGRVRSILRESGGWMGNGAVGGFFSVAHAVWSIENT